MAGSHQLWRLDVRTGALSAGAGNGREGLDDGLLAEATFAQPSGLATDGQVLFVADSEASAIRRVDPRAGTVKTLAGEGLFEFGLRDGGPSDGPASSTRSGSRSRAGPLGVGHLQRGSPPGVARRRPGEHGGARARPARGLTLAGGRLVVVDTDHHRLVTVYPAPARRRPARLAGVAPPPSRGWWSGRSSPPVPCRSSTSRMRAVASASPRPAARGASSGGAHLHRGRSAAGRAGGGGRYAPVQLESGGGLLRASAAIPPLRTASDAVSRCRSITAGTDRVGLPGGPAAAAHTVGPGRRGAAGRNRALPTHPASARFLRVWRGDKVPPGRRFEVKTPGHDPHVEPHGHVSLGLQHRLHRGPVRPVARGPDVGRSELARALRRRPHRRSAPSSAPVTGARSPPTVMRPPTARGSWRGRQRRERRGGGRRARPRAGGLGGRRARGSGRDAARSPGWTRRCTRSGCADISSRRSTRWAVARPEMNHVADLAMASDAPFAPEELEQVVDSSEVFADRKRVKVTELLGRLRRTYCGHIGVEYMTLYDSARRRWLMPRMEHTENRLDPSPSEQRRILETLTYADTFEAFIHTKYQGAKRFSVEGGESLLADDRHHARARRRAGRGGGRHRHGPPRPAERAHQRPGQEPGSDLQRVQRAGGPADVHGPGRREVPHGLLVGRHHLRPASGSTSAWPSTPATWSSCTRWSRAALGPSRSGWTGRTGARCCRWSSTATRPSPARASSRRR